MHKKKHKPVHQNNDVQQLLQRTKEDLSIGRYGHARRLQAQIIALSSKNPKVQQNAQALRDNLSFDRVATSVGAVITLVYVLAWSLVL